MDKNSARSFGLAARRALPRKLRSAYDASLLNRMIALAEEAEEIGCYVSTADEADTRAFLAWCFEHQKPVSVPLVTGHTLTFHRVTSFADLHEGAFGILEPENTEATDRSLIDLMFVPLSSFDQNGNRTGYGKGYYDSVLLPSMRKVGIAYPEQQVDSIDADPWDIPLDTVLLPEMETN